LPGGVDREQPGQTGLVHRSGDDAAGGIGMPIDLVGPGDGIARMPVIVEVGESVLTLGGAEVVGEVVTVDRRRRARSAQVGETRGIVRIDERTGVGKVGRARDLLVAEGRRILVGLNFMALLNFKWV
jgi:hypothetical protein